MVRLAFVVDPFEQASSGFSKAVGRKARALGCLCLDRESLPTNTQAMSYTEICEVRGVWLRASPSRGDKKNAVQQVLFFLHLATPLFATRQGCKAPCFLTGGNQVKGQKGQWGDGR